MRIIKAEKIIFTSIITRLTERIQNFKTVNATRLPIVLSKTLAFY